MSYDVVIPVVNRNIISLPITIKKLREYLCVDDIVCVGNAELENVAISHGCLFIEENNLMEGLTYSSIKKNICKRDEYAGKRTGWYLQQFIKMAYSLICDKDEYLVWDADTIPLKKIHMHNPSGRHYFDIKDEYNGPYFYTMRRLFRQSIKHPGFSYISEHMIIDKKYMRELISFIEANDEIEGDKFFVKVLNSVNDIDLLQSGFSEFETYGNYISIYHPHEYELRRLSSLRERKLKIYSLREVDEIISAMGDTYDIVTIENR